MTDQNVRRAMLAATVVLGLLAAGCPSPPPTPGGPTTPPVKPPAPPAVGTMKVGYLDQGWSANVRDLFHYTSQGSELIPYGWFMALEEAHSATLFKDGLKKYGFLFEPAASDPKGLNPDGLPIGFVKNEESQTLNGVQEAHWVGLTCAACHTGALTYKAQPTDTEETTLIIDGAPTSADFGAFMKDLAEAVQATNDDPQKLKTFTEKVASAGQGGSATDVEAKFKIFAAQLAKIAQCAAPTNPWGPGRSDAFGVIFNRVCAYDLPDTTDKIVPPDAPVSYPFLWNSHLQDHIQWHGEVPNRDWFERLGRNTGEVLGVFARIDIKPGKPGYASSVAPLGLSLLDGYVSRLKPPVWPEALGKLDPDKIARGKTIYQKSCIGCHKEIPADGSLIAMKPTPLSEVQTDDTMTVVVHTRTAPTAGLAGKPKLVILGESFGSVAPAAEILGNAGVGSLLAKKEAAATAYLQFLLEQQHLAVQKKKAASAGTRGLEPQKPADTVTTKALANAYRVTDPAQTKTTTTPGPDRTKIDRTKIGYEARSLAGIWATSPYLHNGSVPNLAQLLRLDPREARFHVGSLAFDAVKVGYVSDGSRGGAIFDTALPGNSNSGHDYGVNLTPAEKQDLIEYLKSL